MTALLRCNDSDLHIRADVSWNNARTLAAATSQRDSVHVVSAPDEGKKSTIHVLGRCRQTEHIAVDNVTVESMLLSSQELLIKDRMY